VSRKQLVILVAGMTLAFNAFAGSNSGFTGKWILDDRGSSMTSETPLGLVQEIKSSGSGYTIESRFKEPKNGVVPLLYLGIMTTRLELAGDGSEKQNQIGPFQQASKTTVAGNNMVTEWRATVNGDEVLGKWTRTTSDDGKHLTLQIHESCKGQDKEATLIFKRK
jgi:hypothetical protein